MDPSKLNISTRAKEKIRRSFLSSRSLKRKIAEELDTSIKDTASTIEEISRSSDEASEPKVKASGTKHETVPRLNEGVLFVGKDDGFPIITSVFSLIPCDSHEENDSSSDVSSDKITLLAENAETPPTSSNKLPFVVQCNNGVITVCSPPQTPGATTITNHVSPFPGDPKQVTQTTDSTAISSSQAAGSCGGNSTATSVAKIPIHELPRSTVSSSQSTSTISCQSPTIPNQAPVFPQANQCEVKGFYKVVYQRPILPKPNNAASAVDISEEDSQLNNELEEKSEEKEACPLNVATPIAAISPHDAHMDDDDAETAERASSPPNSDPPVEEEPSLVTEQDDRIRRLKDLLHKQEKELERVRFKGEGNKSDSLSPKTASDKQLGIKPLKTSSCVGPHTPPKASTGVETQSEDSISGPSTEDERFNVNEGQIDFPKDSPSLLKRKSPPEIRRSIRAFQQNTSPPLKKRHSASELNRPKVSASQDKYRLVNVTVVSGHTRTLAVPVESKQESTISSKKQVKKSTVKSATKVNKMAEASMKCPRKQGRPSKVSRPIASTQSSSNNSSDVGTKHSHHLCNSKSDVTPKVSSSATVTQAANNANNFTADVSSANDSAELSLSTKKVGAIVSLGNQPSQTSNLNISNANKVVPSQAGAHVATSTLHDLEQTLGPLTFTLKQPVPQPPGNRLDACIPQAIKSNPTKLTLSCTNTLPSNARKLPTPCVQTIRNPNFGLGEGSTLLNSVRATNGSVEVRPISLSASTLQTIQNQVFALTPNARIGKIPSQCTTSVATNDQLNSTSSRPLYNLAPKPPSMLSKENKFLIYSLPTPAVTAAGASVKVNNVADGKILICNIPQQTTTKPGGVPSSPSNTNCGKMVFYVSKQGVAKNIGIIHAAKPCLATKNVIEVKEKPPVTRGPEFIPNADDLDFTRLIGLENVVCSLNKDR